MMMLNSTLVRFGLAFAATLFLSAELVGTLNSLLAQVHH
jgi:hypothetical protein